MVHIRQSRPDSDLGFQVEVLETFQGVSPTLETTQRQLNGFFSQLPYECHLGEVASVGD